jgi:8-oxo-dGTP pyrophosphatase MutT (NUDIX family)
MQRFQAAFNFTEAFHLRQHPSSRLLVIDTQQRVLLFLFNHMDGALAGTSHWATPGGGLEHAETFEQAAIRELQEETGIVITDPGPQIGARSVVLTLPDGEIVQAEERYFAVRVDDHRIAKDGWTAHEVTCMAAHRWWSIDELQNTSETVWPENLIAMLQTASADSTVS